MGKLLTPRFAPAALSSEVHDNLVTNRQTDSYYCKFDQQYINTLKSIIIIMTVDIHKNHNKLSIVGIAKWQVRTEGADLAGGARSNLAIWACKNVTNTQTYTSSLYIYRQLGRGKAK